MSKGLKSVKKKSYNETPIKFKGRMNMTRESQKRAVRKYDNANTVQFRMKLNKKTDEDILKKLEEVDNKQGYVKKLIRDDLSK